MLQRAGAQSLHCKRSSFGGACFNWDAASCQYSSIQHMMQYMVMKPKYISLELAQSAYTATLTLSGEKNAIVVVEVESMEGSDRCPTSLLREHSVPLAKLSLSSEAMRCREAAARLVSPACRGVRAPLHTLARSLSRR